MRKIFLYLLIFICICFVLPIIFTSRFSEKVNVKVNLSEEEIQLYQEIETYRNARMIIKNIKK